MTKRIVFLGWSALLAFAGTCVAQTPAIQKAVDAHLQKEREIQEKKSTTKPAELNFDLKPPVDKDGKPLSLGALLDKAVKHNADIRHADTKVREAEANLAKTRLQVMQQVVLMHQEVENAKSNLDRVKKLYQQKVESAESLQRTQSELARAEAQLAFLLGDQQRPATIHFTPDGSGIRVWDFDPSVRVDAQRRLEHDLGTEWQMQAAREAISSGTQAVKLRKALSHLVRLKAEDHECIDVVERIRDLMKGINLTVSGKLPDQRATVDFKEAVELGAVLQWFEDEFKCRFVLRDYGVVLVSADRVPPGGILVQSFWKSSASKEQESESKAK